MAAPHSAAHIDAPAAASTSRAALNAIGSVIGLVLVATGLTLTLLFAPDIVSMETRGTDWIAVSLTIVGALLFGVVALGSIWASWTPLVPGVIITGLSIWAIVMPLSPNGGAAVINKAFTWLFKKGELGYFFINGIGLMVGFTLIATGIAAAVLRRSGSKKSV